MTIFDPNLANSPLLSAQEVMDRSFSDVDPADLVKWVTNGFLTTEKTESFISSREPFFVGEAQQEVDFLLDDKKEVGTFIQSSATSSDFTFSGSQQQDTDLTSSLSITSEDKQQKVSRKRKEPTQNTPSSVPEVAQIPSPAITFPQVPTQSTNGDFVDVESLAAEYSRLSQAPNSVTQSEATPTSSTSITSPTSTRSKKVAKRKKSAFTEQVRAKRPSTTSDEYEPIIRAFQESNGNLNLLVLVKSYYPGRPKMVGPIRRYINVISTCMNYEYTNQRIISNRSDPALEAICRGNADLTRIFSLLAVARDYTKFYVDYYNNELTQSFH
ncbi:MAG TPA: hypothetical protein VLG76_07150 [Rhabdochlamydiaceae bacterium]|nr:hypothetical protein [Rhabdochlamydiaceae bacterium]